MKAVRALLYVLKRLPAHGTREQEEASQVLTQVLRVVNANTVNAAGGGGDDEARRASFQGVLEVLATELFNPAAPQIVRRNVQTCLAFLGSRTAVEVTELLEKVHAPLLAPLLQKQLRTRHIELQVRPCISGNVL